MARNKIDYMKPESAASAVANNRSTGYRRQAIPRKPEIEAERLFKSNFNNGADGAGTRAGKASRDANLKRRAIPKRTLTLEAEELCFERQEEEALPISTICTGTDKTIDGVTMRACPPDCPKHTTFTHSYDRTKERISPRVLKGAGSLTYGN